VNVYFISGLGVDRRVFQKLQLPAHYHLHYLDWITPLPQEAMSHYAQRLAQAINQLQPFALIGLSFGGMIATEITALLHPAKTIIISSASNKYELPPYFRMIGLTGLHQIVPISFLKKPNPLFHWLFGIVTQEEKVLFRNIIKDADNKVLQWSINAVLRWPRKERPPGIVHIHGTADHILPIQFAKPDIVVPGGRHFMVYSMPEKLSQLIVGILKD